jgi:hypothetical protein
VLRCVGCGGPVSPWAARCPACGHPADDAEGLEAAPPSAGAPAGPPALPPAVSAAAPAMSAAAVAAPVLARSAAWWSFQSRWFQSRWLQSRWFQSRWFQSRWFQSRWLQNRWGRLVAVVTVAVVVGAAVSVVALTPGRGVLPGGEVVSATSADGIVVTTTAGDVTASLPPIPGTGLLVAIDGRYLATGTGQEYVLRGRALAPTGRDIPFVGPPGSWRAVDFTDHDRGLVATDSSSDFGGVEAVTFAGHRTADLGAAESAVGDPDALGIFAVYADPGAGPGYERSNPLTDTRIERRDAGAPPVVLAGADQVSADLGEPAGTPAILSVLPDPEGDRIAVLVVPAGPQPLRAGIVVLSRTGLLLGVVHLAGQGVGQPAWSPNGRSLVYDASTPAHAAVAVWKVGRLPVIRTLRPPRPTSPPTSGPARPPFTGLGRCLWAVAGNGFLCADSQIGETTTAWLLGRAGGGTLVQVIGPSFPLAWLPVSGTAPS